MPAKASGLVSSSTRCPASRPSPSTEMTTKSSGEIFARSGCRSSVFGTCPQDEAKTFCASSLVHTIEHSIGVIDTFKNGCWLAQEVFVASRSSVSVYVPFLCEDDGNNNFRIDCK